MNGGPVPLRSGSLRALILWRPIEQCLGAVIPRRQLFSLLTGVICQQTVNRSLVSVIGREDLCWLVHGGDGAPWTLQLLGSV